MARRPREEDAELVGDRGGAGATKRRPAPGTDSGRVGLESLPTPSRPATAVCANPTASGAGAGDSAARALPRAEALLGDFFNRAQGAGSSGRGGGGKPAEATAGGSAALALPGSRPRAQHQHHHQHHHRRGSQRRGGGAQRMGRGRGFRGGGFDVTRYVKRSFLEDPWKDLIAENEGT
ncbi:hypothetical protein HKI87_01g05790 [Chloropicon roscoffensis]|uniref:Uncharacterized protein n=2 Tax=Chloropicon roscoffensis TaxID=1461544 RepID=A0AAX4NYR2_9CHLO